MANIDINLKNKAFSYSIITGAFSSADLISKIKDYCADKKILVIISSKVNKLYGQEIFSNDKEFKPFKFVMKDGEKYKNFDTYKKIIDFAIKSGLTRNDYIVAIGGGVVGDMAGFVASTYMRGVKLIQIPTTLLACVDSSVGGKTGIDTKFGKNLIGTFYQPSLVIINTNFLKTLDKRQYKSGLAECIKYAFIEKTCGLNEYFNLINFLNENADKINSCNSKILEELIEKCVTLKKSVVEQDEHEANLRKILNFGHTFGHALENYGKYKKYTHGEAVVQGIFFALELAYKKALITDNYKYSAIEIINKLGFDKIKLPPLKKLLSTMHHDKKNENNKELIFVLPIEYAQVDIVKVTEDELLKAF